MPKQMMINTVAGQECRIAILSDDGLEELYVERTSTASRVGNIYKARVTNVESAIQAAFVDTGLGKNGFLHISDINPTYFPKNKRTVENVGQKRSHHYRPPIQECLRRGQEVVVQMIKEGIGTKGPTMTTYLSIPGRLLVMMPGMSRLGVSRKVEDEDARDKARSALSELTLPPDMGFIVRTAGIDRSKRDLQRDLNYLLRLWKAVKQQIKRAPTPSEIYQESDLVTRTIRDVYSAEIERVICDSAPVARQVEQFLNVAVPRGKHSVELYTGKEGLYYEAGLEAEIEKIHSRRVELPMGGSLIFDQTEALVAIDVNSGRFRQHSDAETTALNLNLQAAKEVARQLRLRDMGGMIVIDFIDMREEKNRRLLEKTLKEAMKPDRAKTKVLRTSAFGIIELTRQRLGPSLKQSYYNLCGLCNGLGIVQSEESLSLKIIRNVQRASADPNVDHIEAIVPPEVAHFLLNRQRLQISRLEDETGKTIIVRADSEVGSGNGTISCTNSRGAPVAWEHQAVPKSARKPLATIPIADVPVSAAPSPDEGLAAASAMLAGGAHTPVLADGPAYAEIDFDEIEAGDGLDMDIDEEDAELDRVISATDFDDQGEGEDGEPAATGSEARESASGSAASGEAQATAGEDPGGEIKKKRRGRRGGRKHRHRREAAAEGAEADGTQQPAQPGQPQPTPAQAPQPRQQQPKPPAEARAGEQPAGETDENGAPKKKRRRRRRRKSHAAEAAPDATRQEHDAAQESPAQTKPAEPAPQVPQEPEMPPAKAESKPAAKKAKRVRRKKVATAKPPEETSEPKPTAAKKAVSDKPDAGPETGTDEPAKPKPKKARRRRTKKAVATDNPEADKKPDAGKADSET